MKSNINASKEILKKLNKPVDTLNTYWGGENKWKNHAKRS